MSGCKELLVRQQIETGTQTNRQANTQRYYVLQLGFRELERLVPRPGFVLNFSPPGSELLVCISAC